MEFRIQGLQQFRAALKAAEDASSRQLTTALKASSKKVQQAARARAPRKSGKLAKGYKAFGRSSRRKVITGVRNKVPYATGAEFGARGKWKGFRRLGPRGKRILYAAFEAEKATLGEEALEAIADVAVAQGWLQRA